MTSDGVQDPSATAHAQSTDTAMETADKGKGKAPAEQEVMEEDDDSSEDDEEVSG